MSGASITQLATLPIDTAIGAFERPRFVTLSSTRLTATKESDKPGPGKGVSEL